MFKLFLKEIKNYDRISLFYDSKSEIFSEYLSDIIENYFIKKHGDKFIMFKMNELLNSNSFYEDYMTMRENFDKKIKLYDNFFYSGYLINYANSLSSNRTSHIVLKSDLTLQLRNNKLYIIKERYNYILLKKFNDFEISKFNIPVFLRNKKIKELLNKIEC